MSEYNNFRHQLIMEYGPFVPDWFVDEKWDEMCAEEAMADYVYNEVYSCVYSCYEAYNDDELSLTDKQLDVIFDNEYSLHFDSDETQFDMECRINDLLYTLFILQPSDIDRFINDWYDTSAFDKLSYLDIKNDIKNSERILHRNSVIQKVNSLSLITVPGYYELIDNLKKLATFKDLNKFEIDYDRINSKYIYRINNTMTGLTYDQLVNEFDDYLRHVIANDLSVWYDILD